MQELRGGCHCGNITYTAEIDSDKVGLCHCTDCQTLSGSAFSVMAMTREGAFELKSGELKVYIKTAESGNQREQTFCPDCGTPFYATSVGDGPRVFNLRTGSIRQRKQLVPKRQVWIRSAHDWLGGIGEMPSLEKQGT